MAVRVKLMNEYTIDWPLWAFDGPAPEGALPVSSAISGELRSWARNFKEHYDPERGWDDRRLAEDHASEARRLQRALQEDLGSEYEVVLDLWEVPTP